MPSLVRLRVAAILISLVCTQTVVAGALTPHLLSMRGLATSETGIPLPSSDLAVRVFTEPTGGTEVFNSGSDFSGAIQDGAFDVVVGGVAVLNLDNTLLYYMEIDVGGAEVVGDASAGRIPFYPGGGSHDRPDFEARLEALEIVMLPKKSSLVPAAGPAQGDKFGGSSADYTLRSGLLGMALPSGSTSEYGLLSTLLFQPVGEFSSESVILHLGPYYALPGGGCCVGSSVGNMDNVPGTPDMGDLTLLIDMLFISLNPLPCLQEANVDFQPPGSMPDPIPTDVTMGDLTVLIDNLFISLNPLPPCP